MTASDPPDPQIAKRRDPVLMVAWVLLPPLMTAYQIMSKHIALDVGAGFDPRWLQPILTTPLLALLILTEIGSFVTWMYVLARTPLSEALPLSAVTYIFVLAASWLLFGEHISASQIIGSAAIIAGVWLIGRGQ